MKLEKTFRILKIKISPGGKMITRRPLMMDMDRKVTRTMNLKDIMGGRTQIITPHTDFNYLSAGSLPPNTPAKISHTRTRRRLPGADVIAAPTSWGIAEERMPPRPPTPDGGGMGRRVADVMTPTPPDM